MSHIVIAEIKVETMVWASRQVYIILIRDDNFVLWKIFRCMFEVNSLNFCLTFYILYRMRGIFMSGGVGLLSISQLTFMSLSVSLN